MFSASSLRNRTAGGHHRFCKYSPDDRFDLWLLDTTTRRWRHVPDMPMHLIRKVTDVKWTSDGRIVILSGAVLAVWRPGEKHLAHPSDQAAEAARR
jgi:hypothetical protein